MALLDHLEIISDPSSLLALVIILYACHTHYNSRRLAHIPGPWYTRYSKIPLLFWSARGTAWQNLGQYCRVHGSLIRVAPNQLITGSVTQYKKMYAARAKDGYPRSDWFYTMRFKPGSDNALSVQDEAAHANMRSKLTGGYAGKENPDFEKTIDEQVLRFVELIENKYLSEPSKGMYRPLDFARKASFFTLDVISALAFSESFGNLEADDDRLGFIGEVERTIGVMITMALLPWLFKFLEKTQILKMLGPSDRDDLGLGKTFQVAAKIVSQRFDGLPYESSKNPPGVERLDMMASFIRHGMTREQLESETVLSILAGSDTAATATRSIFFHVVSNPRVYQKLQQEVDLMTLEGPVISDGLARMMPYLQSCIKEGLRMWPPVSGLLSHEVPRGGDTIDGYFVPEGTRIGWSTYAIMRDPQVFGPDEDCFRPERWMLTSKGGDCESLEQLQVIERSIELIFSYGRFKCPGQSVASCELNKIFVELLRRFDWSLCFPLHPLEMNYQAGIWVQQGMWMKAVKRKTP